MAIACNSSARQRMRQKICSPRAMYKSYRGHSIRYLVNLVDQEGNFREVFGFSDDQLDDFGSIRLNHHLMQRILRPAPIREPSKSRAIHPKPPEFDASNQVHPHSASIEICPADSSVRDSGGSPTSCPGTFKLNPQNIQKLKQLVLSRRNPAHISTFTVAMAYTWVCAAVADDSTHDAEMVFGMSVDARPRLDPPVPANYFGNCLVIRATTVERAKLVAENGVVAAVEAISEAIKSLEDDGALNGAEIWVPLLTQALESNRKLFSTAGSPRFELYGVDFGWGTPAKVEVVSTDGTGAVSVCDGRDGGLELGWAAKRDVMEKFAAVFAKGLEEL